jgi:hypothetical protein
VRTGRVNLHPVPPAPRPPKRATARVADAGGRNLVREALQELERVAEALPTERSCERAGGSTGGSTGANGSRFVLALAREIDCVVIPSGVLHDPLDGCR